MELINQQALPVSQAIAWDALNDTSLLQQSIPGCEAITPTGDNEYQVLMTAAIGPVKAKFKGKLKLSDINPPNSYTMAFEGQGGAAGHGKGTATVRLEATGPDDTLLHYAVTASVGGKIAQVGSRLVDMAAQKIANDFFGNFTAVLQARHPRAADAGEVAPKASPGAWARFMVWLRGLLG